MALGPIVGVLFDGFEYGMLLFLLSVGLSVTLGMMNFVNLAHCAFAMLGGYVTVTLMNTYGWPFLATLPLAFLVAAVVSVTFERTLYRRLYRASELDQVLLTIGLTFMSVGAAAYVFGTLQQPISTPPWLRGIRENPVRMPAIGAPTRSHIRTIYTISAIVAGVAGAVLAETTSTVSLGVLDFQRSAEVVIILVLGGAGRLYDGLVGAIIFMVARDQFSGIAPQYWYFWIGALLVAVVMLLPNGVLGGLARLTSAVASA